MSNFSHLNPLAESILKILADRPATPANLIFVLRCDKPTLGKHLKYLLAEEYVFNSKQPDNQKDSFGLTLSTRLCLGRH